MLERLSVVKASLLNLENRKPEFPIGCQGRDRTSKTVMASKPAVRSM